MERMVIIVNQLAVFAHASQISAVISVKNVPKIITICRNVRRAIAIALVPLAIHVILQLVNVNVAANLMDNVVIDAKMVITIIPSVHVSDYFLNSWQRISVPIKIIFVADCNCDVLGTLEEVCDKDAGKCLCKEGFGGPRCDQCIPGYYNYPDCVPCNCSIIGSVSTVCDASGKCPCLNSFAGKQCTLCSAGYYNYPECLRKHQPEI